MEFEINQRERIYFVIMSVVSLFVYAFMLYSRFMWIYIIASAALHKILSLFMMGYIKGNGIRLSKRQFPEVYALLERHCASLHIPVVPDIYLLQGGGILNAFATRHSGKNCIVLYSGIMEAALEEGMDAVSFILGHELGHIKRNHVSLLKGILTRPASLIPFLGNAYSRACEYTCDAIGQALCPSGAVQGLLVLAAGKHLYKKVDVQEHLWSFEQEGNFAIRLAELFSTHPVLAKRIKCIQSRSIDVHSQQDPILSPKFNWKNDQLQP